MSRWGHRARTRRPCNRGHLLIVKRLACGHAERMSKRDHNRVVSDAANFTLLSPEVRKTPQMGGPVGHRARLRARFLSAGSAALADHELIEMTLFLALPRRDTKPLARDLLARFGSYAGVISASAPELLEIEGLGEAGVAALKLVQAAAQRLVKADVQRRPLLNNWQRLMDYLHSMLARERVEHVHVLYLDNHNCLLADVPQAVGTVNHTPVYPREVLKRALELHATALILVHNHPSGDPTPSEGDILMTREIKKAGVALSVALHDHVIIGNGKHFSFRQEGML